MPIKTVRSLQGARDFARSVFTLALCGWPLLACSEGPSSDTTAFLRPVQDCAAGAAGSAASGGGLTAAQSGSAGSGAQQASQGGAAVSAGAGGEVQNPQGQGGFVDADQVVCTGALEFTHQAIDDTFEGDDKALGDLNGDGLLDVIVGSAGARWYEAPSWTQHEVEGSGGWLTSHMQTADINRDGATDIITPDGHDVYWFENPRGSGGSVDDFWERHLIATREDLTHEIIVVDLNHDDKLDIVGNPPLQVWIQGESPTSWSAVDLSAFSNVEGLDVGRIDDDDVPDLVVNSSWIHVPADVNDASAYVSHPFEVPQYWSVSLRIADIDENGKPDILLAPAHDSIGDVVWYSADDPTADWTKHVIGQAGYVHQFVVADIDRQGRLDVVFAECAPSPTSRVGMFLNRGDEQWDVDVIAETGSHNILVGDLGNDCDLDIAGVDWDGPPVEIWENALCDDAEQRCNGVANYRP